jgi:predicted  nucleic acid-binding Zn-ribbon protein
MAKYNDLVNKHMMMEKELVALKKVSRSKANANKELVAFRKKKKGNKKRLKAEKQKNKLTNLNIEKEKSVKA